MQALNFNPRTFRMLTATLLLALAATVTQNALAQPHGGPGGHGGGFGPGLAMAQPKHIDRLLDSINASADQRSQIQALVAAARTELQPQRDAGRKLREQSQALFTQPTVDACAAEALRVQMLAVHDQVSKRSLQLMLDVSRVLSPEQRKAIAERMAQRRTMMERHHAERSALDNPTR